MKKEIGAKLIEFAERLKKEVETIDLGCGCGSYEYVPVECIDDVLDKMLEEVKGGVK